MKKTFSLTSATLPADRVIEAVKHDIRKYLRRERRRDLPKGMDYWEFDCRAGLDEAAAMPMHVGALIGQIDEAVKAASPQCYVEILARPAVRQPRAAAENELADNESAGNESNDVPTASRKSNADAVLANALQDGQAATPSKVDTAD